MLRKKSLEESVLKWLEARNYSIAYEPKSLNKNPKQNALEYLAFGKGFIMDRIIDARNLNENLEKNLKPESLNTKH